MGGTHTRNAKERRRGEEEGDLVIVNPPDSLVSGKRGGSQKERERRKHDSLPSQTRKRKRIRGTRGGRHTLFLLWLVDVEKKYRAAKKRGKEKGKERRLSPRKSRVGKLENLNDPKKKKKKKKEKERRKINILSLLALVR